MIANLVLGDLGDPMIAFTTLVGAWQLLQRCAGRAADEQKGDDHGDRSPFLSGVPED